MKHVNIDFTAVDLTSGFTARDGGVAGIHEKILTNDLDMETLDLLEESAVFTDYLGKRFVDVYLETKWAERDKFFSRITPLEYEWYLDRV